jgi:hypothetical protein
MTHSVGLSEREATVIGFSKLATAVVAMEFGTAATTPDAVAGDPPSV